MKFLYDVIFDRILQVDAVDVLASDFMFKDCLFRILWPFLTYVKKPRTDILRVYLRNLLENNKIRI